MDPRCFQRETAGRRRRHQVEREIVSQKEVSHSSNNVLDILKDETEAQTMMCQWWVETLFEVNCLDVHVLGLSLKL